MRLSNFIVFTDAINHIRTHYYGKLDTLHIIIPDESLMYQVSDLLHNAKITFLKRQYNLQVITELSLELKRSNLNYTIADKVVNYPYAEQDHGNKTHSLLYAAQQQLLEQDKQYIEKIISDKTVIIVETSVNKARLQAKSLAQFDNCEIVLIGYHSPTSLQELGLEGSFPSLILSDNRSIIFSDPGSWHKQGFTSPLGIEIVDCESIEEQAKVIANLAQKNSSIITHNLPLLQRLEVMLSDFSYNKPASLSPIVRLLLHIIQDPKSPALIANPYIKQNVPTAKSLFRGLGLGKQYIAAHINYFRLLSDINFDGVTTKFMQDIEGVISSVRINSLDEYIEIYSILSQNISYPSNQDPIIRALPSIIAPLLLSDEVVITTDGWQDESTFYSLLSAKKVFIVHKNGVQEPQWLNKLRVLLSPIKITNYSAPCILKQKNSLIKNFAIPDYRPKTLSATMIEMLMRDPYAFYIRYILQVAPLDTKVEAIEFGNFIHNTLQRYDNHSYDQLLQYGKEELDKYNNIHKSIWWPKFQKIALHFIQQDNERRAQIIKIENEVTLNFTINEYTIKVTCDRLEHLRNGKIAIIEYKTGLLPLSQDITSGLSPQLLLQGIAAQKSLEKEILELAYWQLKPDGITVKTISNIEEEITNTLTGLSNLLKIFNNMSFHPTSYYKNYQHTARATEVLSLL